MFSVHPTTAIESNLTRPTMVLDGPMFIPLTMLFTNCCMNLQLPHVESRPYTKLGSASHMLPESSRTKTRSMSLVHPDKISMGELGSIKTQPNDRTINRWSRVEYCHMQCRRKLKKWGSHLFHCWGTCKTLQYAYMVPRPFINKTIFKGCEGGFYK